MKTLEKIGVPSVFDDFIVRDLFNVPGFNRGMQSSVPAANVKETETGFQIELAAPGLKKENFRVNIDGKVLSINAEKTEEKSEGEKDRYTRKEFSFHSFSRSFTLPERTIDVENISAQYEDGILKLQIPKLKEAIKTNRVIEIQ
jgi:HSP20 family protein